MALFKIILIICQLIAYKTLCLPHLEYASAAWDPTCKKDISGLKKVQVNAMRFTAKAVKMSKVPRRDSAYNRLSKEGEPDVLIL